MSVAMVMLVKMTVVGVGLQTLGFSRKAAVLGGLSLAQVSEVSLFLMARAHEYHLISRYLYLMVVATTVVLLVLTPLSIHAFNGVDRSTYKLRPNSNPPSPQPLIWWWRPQMHHGHASSDDIDQEKDFMLNKSNSCTV